MNVYLLGQTAAVIDGRRVTGRDFGGIKPRQILEILALEAGSLVAKDRLADLLWDGRPPASAMATLEGYVSLLRRALQPGAGSRGSVVVTRQGGYQLDTTLVSVDLATVEEQLALLTASRAGLPRAIEGAIERAVEAALSIEPARLLESEPSAAWADERRRALAARLHDACIAGAEQALRLGDLATARRLALRAVDGDELREDAWRLLMEVQRRQGDRAEVLRSYHRCRTVLDDELGVRPSARTQEPYLRVLRDPEPVAPALDDVVLDRLARQVAGGLARAYPADGTVPWESRLLDFVDRLTAMAARPVALAG